MSAKEVMLKAINMEKPERVPALLFSGGVWTFNNRGYNLEELQGKPKLIAQIIIETNEEVGSDAVWTGSGYNNLLVRALGGRVKFREKGALDVPEPFIKDAANIDQVDPGRLADDEGIRGLWESAALVDRAIGQDTLIGACGWGPFTLAGQLYGVEKLMFNMYKDKASVHAVVDFAAEVSFRYYEPYVKAGARVISVAEPSASGDLISRRHFEEFALPYLKKINSRLKEVGASVLVHICGDITNRLDLLPDSGADVLSVDYKVDLARVKEVVGYKIAFAGNVNPVAILENGTPAEVAAASRECIEKSGQQGNFILMAGCDIPPTVPLANIKALIETGANWRL